MFRLLKTFQLKNVNPASANRMAPPVRTRSVQPSGQAFRAGIVIEAIIEREDNPADRQSQ